MSKSAIGIIAVVAVAVVGGLAFTAGNTLPATTVVRGYASQTITGVTANQVNYNTSTNGETIESVGLVLQGDTRAKVIKIAFNDAAPATCTGAGAYDTTTTLTTYTCTVNQPVATATKFALVAS